MNNVNAIAILMFTVLAFAILIPAALLVEEYPGCWYGFAFILTIVLLVSLRVRARRS